MPITTLLHSPLGKKTEYKDTYAPELLFPIPRAMGREELSLSGDLPFTGCDSWTAYELSWLSPSGKPCAAMAEILFPCDSPNLIESKSVKLYFNSFNQTTFTDQELVRETIINDLSNAAEAPVTLSFLTPDELHCTEFLGTCLDSLDITVNTYHVDSSFLKTNDIIRKEILYSHIFRSNCLKTGQPDWGSVHISYRGKQLCHEGLLRYLLSFRLHQGFHEQCVERIFVDIMRCCAPKKLTVSARYLRRGGLDINPTRSTNIENCHTMLRLVRQ